MSELKVGFIGLGAMGWSMAGHLKKAGLLVGVANRSAAKAEQFGKEQGVVGAKSTGELAPLCDVIVLCVSADVDVLSVTHDIAANAKLGTIVIDHSTVSAKTAKDAHASMQAAGGDFIDAPVSGGVEGAKNGKLSIMAGGDAGALEKVRPVLESYAARISLMGGVGAGQSTKAVNQILIAGVMQGFGEGLALAEALGLDPVALMSTLTSGAANSWYLEKRGASALRNEFSVGFKAALMHKDLGIGKQLAESAGTSRAVIDKTIADLAELMAQGHGDEDVSSILRLKRARREK